jgi:DNA-binding CsgD family transcriptional regulator
MSEGNTAQPESDTRRRVREMTAAGLSVREIALALGLSTERIYQQKRAIARDQTKTA